MDKAFEMGKTSATGSFHLLIGVAGSTIIMFFGTYIINTLLPVGGVGLYGMALIPATMINFFRDWGVNMAMTQQIASLRTAGRDSEIHDVILSGILFEIITGTICSLVCFALAQPLALILSSTNPASAPQLSVYISIMSFSIFAGALFSAATAIFTGFERMKLNSYTQILQAIVKTAFGPILVIIGFGVLGAVFASMASLVAGGVVGITLVYFLFFRRLRKCKVGKCDVKLTLKPMLKYGLPLTVSNTVVGVLPQVFAFSMAAYAGEWMMGNYYSAAYFSVLLTFITIPIATALFPSFSKIDPEKEPEVVKTVFVSSTKYAALLLVPATMILVTLSTPLINFLFPQNGLFHSLLVVDAAPKFPYAPLFLSLSSIVNLLVLIGNISIGPFQSGIGKVRQVMKQSILSLAVGLPLAFFLVSYLNSIGGATYAVIGGIMGVLISTLPACLWGLYWCWRNYKVKVDLRISAKIFLASAIASGLTYILIAFLRLPYLFTLVLGFASFSVVYLIAAPLVGAINETDIDNFKTMFSSSWLVTAVLNIPLGFMGKICKFTNSKKVMLDSNRKTL